jgi:hypothetical protein
VEGTLTNTKDTESVDVAETTLYNFDGLHEERECESQCDSSSEGEKNAHGILSHVRYRTGRPSQFRLR